MCTEPMVLSSVLVQSVCIIVLALAILWVNVDR